MTAEKTVFLFSGQGSQCEKMGVSLVEKYPGLMEIFTEASDILGFDLYGKCAGADAAELSRTVISQPAIMAVSLCAAKALEINGITPGAAAGHSLGEYAAMVCSGIVSRSDGFKLIKARSEAMQRAAEANKGAMYAIIGKSPEEIEKVCAETEGYVVPVNYNSPVQTVIAGEENAAKAAADTLAAAGARAVKLGVSSAFHSKLMESAAAEFKPFAETVTYNAPKIKVYSNLSGRELEGVDDLAERLSKHIISPVRFTDELSELYSAGFDTYIECGPGKVLAGLVKKTLKGVTIANVQDGESLDKAIKL